MAYQRVPGVEIAAVADIMPERAERAAQEWGVPRWFGSVRELLEQDIDAVSVCTFNQAHREPTVAALEAGKHVLLEKPMAANLDDAVAMMRAAKASGKIFHVGFWPRWQPEVQAAKRIVESGALGDLYYAQSANGGRRRIPPGSFLRKAFAGAGPTVDIGCYDLDTFMFLAGAPRPVSVSAMVSYRLGKSLPNVPGDWGHDPAQVEVEDMGHGLRALREWHGAALHHLLGRPRRRHGAEPAARHEGRPPAFAQAHAFPRRVRRAHERVAPDPRPHRAASHAPLRATGPALPSMPCALAAPRLSTPTKCCSAR